MARSAQLDLFAASAGANSAEAEAALARMRGMVECLRAATEPPWKDYMASLLECGAFQRAMHLVPAEQAQPLWLAFDSDVRRLWAVWDAKEAAAERAAS
jgi:hypothetical protein